MKILNLVWIANCPAVFLSYFSLWICYEIQRSKSELQVGWEGHFTNAWPPVHGVWKFENSHSGAKNQSCWKYMLWPIKTCARRTEGQWKKIQRNRAHQFWEKAKKLPKNTTFWENCIFGCLPVLAVGRVELMLMKYI